MESMSGSTDSMKNVDNKRKVAITESGIMYKPFLPDYEDNHT